MRIVLHDLADRKEILAPEIERYVKAQERAMKAEARLKRMLAMVEPRMLTDPSLRFIADSWTIVEEIPKEEGQDEEHDVSLDSE